MHDTDSEHGRGGATPSIIELDEAPFRDYRPTSAMDTFDIFKMFRSFSELDRL